MDLAALRHEESSQTRDRTCVLCTDEQTLTHWATREVFVPTFHTSIRGWEHRVEREAWQRDPTPQPAPSLVCVCV